MSAKEEEEEEEEKQQQKPLDRACCAIATALGHSCCALGTPSVGQLAKDLVVPAAKHTDNGLAM